jgi:uncharacterized pyridoxal phosphate-containing UPF0001 family protein
VIALKKKLQAKKCSDHCTISHIAHTAKIVAKIVTKILRRTEGKLRMYLEISMDSEEEKELGMQLGC